MLSDIVSNWTVDIKQFHVTAVAKSFCFNAMQSHTLPVNKEVSRFGLGALGSSAVFARSVFVQFDLLRSLEYWLDKKKRFKTSIICIEN
ncbi:hypothetical protein KIN20_011943 [Parelaphostrongylus tenuis]|uniref:Uncharacterized protein n=1 Tax=Parelaphostrongylus tenuis TaxID=148309 RepID=A0AAD5N0Q4_PARTN|nr:hypothetical protein KIN20_011943 [Parelaphostrongylus tenuis]